MRIIKRLAVLVATFVALLGSGATAAHATASDWECSTGNLCVYNGADGTGSRCSWSNADNDWLSAPVTCSWARRATYSINNQGTSSSYTGVMLYLSPNYENPYICMPQRQSIELPIGVIFRSHRWVTTSCHGII